MKKSLKIRYRVGSVYKQQDSYLETLYEDKLFILHDKLEYRMYQQDEVILKHLLTGRISSIPLARFKNNFKFDLLSTINNMVNK